jgi:hypothetical protein
MEAKEKQRQIIGQQKKEKKTSKKQKQKNKRRVIEIKGSGINQI